MKHYKVKISMCYEVEAENEEEAIHEAEIVAYEDTFPLYAVEIVSSWEEKEDV